jgi:molybdopterin molybdotransferase
MLPIPEQARAMMLSQLPRMPNQSVSLADAMGRVLAEDIVATRDQPPFAASAMDGYALLSGDTPASLTMIGQSLAGAGYAGKVDTGQCVRIFTGAPLPDGADAVVIQEDITATGDKIETPKTKPNQHIRARGIDFQVGDVLLRQGEKLDAIALSLIAATGRDKVSVARKPVVAILTSGDEIVAPGGVPGPFDVFDALSSGLSALVQGWGGDVMVLAPKRDTIEAIQSGYEEAFARADLVVTIGGASVGDRDLMRPALKAFDAQFHVEKIAVRPGKPTWFATTSRAPVLGLPGNPASALVCAYLFVRPVLMHMQGGDSEIRLQMAKLATPLPANGPREHYLRAFTHNDDTGQMWITPRENQDSSLMSVFQSANALVRLAPTCDALAIGDVVQYLSLDRNV